MRITALKTSLAGVLAAAELITTTAAADGDRDLTVEEQTEFNAKMAEASKLQGQIAREEQLLALKASAAAPIVVGTTGGQPGTVPAAAATPLPAGTMFTRITMSLAACNMDQRAAAAHAEQLWGTETGQIVANQEQSTNVKGGFLVNTAYSADFIDLLRPSVVVRKLGARSIPMPEGNLTMRKKTQGTTAGYVGERTPAPTTDVRVDQMSMSAKTLRALVPITNQLIRRASMGVVQMVRDDLLEGVAVKEDQIFIRSPGDDLTPKGLAALMPAGNKLAITAGQTLESVTADLMRVRLRVINANVPMISCGWVMSWRSKMFLETLRDGNGNIAFPEVAANGTLYGYPIGTTTSVPDNLGAGGNESEIYFGDFSQLLIGDTETVTIASSDTAAYDDAGTIRSAFSNDETVVRLIAEHDTGTRYAVAFAMLTGVTWGA
ncbi:phage major capsid protein [Sphingomonas aquatilis]|uniref:phage major capsid protein n=1 Tax=Sphingomonas aquatilis TaxID=93063 RepID=UPI0023F76E4B|nr:phage major capsid protein [Sphingomonas aquatilis]MCI4653119.1 phage major capsid protein [Sphingomonas aquatilis]